LILELVIENYKEVTMSKLNDDFIYQIVAIVAEIPYGKVATYGQIAKLAGNDRNSRLVGKVLGFAEAFGEIPSHRVVNSSGRLAPCFYQQEGLLLSEGVTFKNNGCVNLKKHQWRLGEK